MIHGTALGQFGLIFRVDFGSLFLSSWFNSVNTAYMKAFVYISLVFLGIYIT